MISAVPAAENPPPLDWDFLLRRLSKAESAPPAEPVQLTQAQTLFNRELSWLAFNDRVLAEASNPAVPALERLRFAAIVSSNLDEFFMVRVAGLKRTSQENPSRRSPDGLSAAQTYSQVREHVIRQKSRQATVFRDILAELRTHGIRIDTQFNGMTRLDETVLGALPELDVVLRRAAQPLPHLDSECLHIYIGFPGEYAIITIKSRQDRLLKVPSKSDPNHYVLVERWLTARAGKLFPGRDVVEAFPFKVIREADLRYRPDDEDSLEEQISQAVGRRGGARVVRLEVDAPHYSEGALSVAMALGLDSGSLYRFDLPLDIRTLIAVYGSAPASSPLRYPPIVPQIPPPLRRKKRIFEVMRGHDILLHHPYDSFDIFVNFLQQAARDPEVTRIYHTLYRTGMRSSVMEALKEAARNGKRVTVYIEIKARFDEQNNLRWAAELRSHGARIIRPMGSLKVHSKATQVFRMEGDKEISYLHLGTGNYHETTARQYTDLGLLTCNEVLGRDVALFFSSLIRHQEPAGFEEVLAAPLNLHRQMHRLIDGEIAIQTQGGKGHIIAKMNSLVDEKTIRKLYEASQAGVRVDLIVRGICCLRPDIKGLSENIRVVSIIDRFLEHSRAYYFRAGGENKVYLSSADWMPRNFFKRFELAFPVKDPTLKRYIREVILGHGLQDNTKAWILRSDGAYVRHPAPPPGKELRSQFALEALARKHYKDTLLEHRIPC